MKTKFKLFRRNGVFYTEDTSTGKQTSLRTKDETEAKSLLNARNEAQRQPTLNLHLARAYPPNRAPVGIVQKLPLWTGYGKARKGVAAMRPQQGASYGSTAAPPLVLVRRHAINLPRIP